MDKKLIILAIIVILAVGGYFTWKAMSGSYSLPTGQADETQMTNTENQNIGNSALTGDAQMPVKEVSVTATEFAFSPKEISVKPGQTVKLTLVNNGNYNHDFSIEKLGVKTKVISKGQSDTIQFTAPAVPGDYPLSAICTIPGHKEAGMTFSFKVE